ncbi:MAG TPA: M28 family peptidase, partial [Polyangiaceae bacterium]|nr:M28 family peptidase [Polyangiaceae bacterium]
MRTHWFAVMAMVACETVPAAVVKEPDVGGIARDASAERIAVDIGTLVTLRNRNTCGAGVEKARDIIKARFETLGLRVKLDEFEAPCGEPVKRQSVIGVIEGRDPTRLVMVGGHYDSRTTDRNDGTSDAPGANDSGSQTALVLEAARLMSGHKYETSVAFVAFAGEEQGLLGSKSVASHLASLFPGATLEAMLDCDIVGGDKDANDDAALRRFRLYAPGAPRETGKDTPDGPIDGTSPSRL